MKTNSFDYSRTSAGFLGLLIVLLTSWTLLADDRMVTAEMAGRFEGKAKIVVDWTQQKELPVVLKIGGAGSVSGKVGDATLKNGRLARNRGAIGRKLNIKTDYIVTGELSGPVISSEKVSRESVSIPLNFQNGAYVGGLHTSGGKIGGKEKRMLSAAGLKLSRVKK